MAETREATGGETQESAMKATQEVTNRTIAVVKEEEEMNLLEFLKDNELLYSKRLRSHKDPNRGSPYGINLELTTRWTRLSVRDSSRAIHMRQGQSGSHINYRQK